MKRNLILLTVLLAALSAFPAEYYVDASRLDDSGAATNWATAKQTIQAAVDLAADGDTVWVTNGVYSTGGMVAPVYKDWDPADTLMNRVCVIQAITVRSVNGAESTVIRGASDYGANGPAAVRCVMLFPGAVMEGFTLTGGHTANWSGGWGDSYGGGALMLADSVLNNCVLIKNSAACGGGAFCWENNRLNNCLLSDNTAGDCGGALVKNGILNNCTISGNTAREYSEFGNIFGGGCGGVDLGSSVMNNCIVWGNTAVRGDNITTWGSGVTIRNTCSSPLPEGEGNICADPIFKNPLGNFRLKQGSPCVDAGSNDYAPATDLDGVVRPVDGDNNGSAITDMGCYELNAASLPKTFYVNAARPDDSGAATNWATAKQTIQAAVDLATDEDTVWVTNGVYDTGGAVAPAYQLFQNGPVIINSLMNRLCISNSITVRSVSGAATTVIQGGDAVRCAYLFPGAVLDGFTLTGSRIASESSEFFDAYGGGALIFTNATLSSCIVSKNLAACGGGIFLWGGVLNSCLLVDNNATFYGGIVMTFGTLNNCTVTGNTATDIGGVSGMRGLLNNCIVWGNTGAESSNINAWADLTVRNTCSLPLQEGEGNICADPLFVDAVHSNFQLLAGSPCINAGNNSTVSTANDLAGNSRIVAGAVDMGAYENSSPIYTITTIAGSNGSITPTNSLVFQGFDQTFLIQPAVGYYIASLTVDGNPVAVASSYAFTNVQSAHTIAATFAAASYTLTIENGSGAGSFTNETVVLISANAAGEGYTFTGWTANPAVYTNRLANVSALSTTFTMPATNVMLTASYRTAYTITTTAGTNGTITPINPVVFQGQNQTFSVQPATGYYIASLTVDGAPVSVVSSYTFTNVQSTHTIAATFAAASYTLTVEKGSGDGSYTNGTVVPITADAAVEGYAFSGWTANPAVYTNRLTNISAASTTFTMPATNVILTASYRTLVFYVDASQPDDSGAATNWATAKKTIQAAVNLTVNGDTIWVTNGVYNTGGKVTPGYSLTNRVCITNAIIVRSVNGPEVTIIKGEAGLNGSNDVNSIRGVFMTNSSTLIGFAINDSYAMNKGNGVFDRSGGGLWLAANCVVSNCVVSGSSSDFGGGVYLCGGGILDNCVLSGNKSIGSGGGVYSSSGGVLSNCILSNNWAGDRGGGAHLSAGVLNHCIFVENRAENMGGGLHSDGGETLDNCTLIRNSAKNFGGVYIHQGVLNNCVLVENFATDLVNGEGGGAACSLSTLNNCTLIGNSSKFGGGVFLYDSQMNNCIAWSNRGFYGKDIFCSGNCTIRYTCASGLTQGSAGCITNNPLFVDEINSNFQLQASSPCINAGSNVYAPTNVVPDDLAGNPRIINGTVDMGAYEFYGAQDDYDGDGLPNEWEVLHFGNINRAAATAICSNGFNTIREAYIAGLDPNDPDSEFMTSASRSPISGNILQWQGVSGRVYSVYYSTNLLNGFQSLETNIPWTAGAFTDTVHQADGSRFYKIHVRLAP
jgi:hypothetical protein